MMGEIPQAALEEPNEDDDETPERVLAIYDQFKSVIDGAFGADRSIDWIVLNIETGEVVTSGTDDELVTEEMFAEWQAEHKRRLILLGRPMVIEEVQRIPALSLPANSNPSLAAAENNSLFPLPTSSV